MTETRSTLFPRGTLPGLAAATCVALAGCASAGGGSAGPAPSSSSATTDATDTGGAAGDYAEADVTFMQGMIHHHAQAIVMARMAPTHDAGPAVSRLAARILNSQKTEIAVMSDWLSDRGESVPESAALAGEAADDAGASRGGEPGPVEGWDAGPQMPGVLSDGQMRELDAARGEEFDRLFLTYMIEHHAGAVTMVENLVRSDRGAREESVFRLASGIRSDQATEIDRMRQMLREQLFGPGSPR